MLSPDATVIIPCYNARGTLPDTIASLQAQTLENWEAICVDDASTDDTFAYLEQIARQDARFRAIRVPHGGLAATRNRGLPHAGAARVAFLDADDVLTPDALERMVAASRRTGDQAIVFTGVELLDQAGRSLDVFRFPGEEAFTVDALLTCNRFCPTALIPIGLLAQRAFDESLPACEDWNLWLELAVRGVPAVVIPAPLVGYRLRTSSLGHKPDLMHTAGQRVLARWSGGLDVAARSGSATRWSVVCACLAAAGGQTDVAERLLAAAGEVESDALQGHLAEGAEWAWEYVCGARGETWRTHAGAWLTSIEDWLNTAVAGPTAEGVLATLRARAVLEGDVLERLARALRERPHKTRLLVYGLGTRGVSLVQRMRRNRALAELEIVAADDGLTDGRFTALQLPRVNPRRWPRWPSDTFAILTPDRPEPLQRTLQIAGGRAGHDFMALRDLAPAATITAAERAVAEVS